MTKKNTFFENKKYQQAWLVDAKTSLAVEKKQTNKL